MKYLISEKPFLCMYNRLAVGKYLFALLFVCLFSNRSWNFAEKRVLKLVSARTAGQAIRSLNLDRFCFQFVLLGIYFRAFLSIGGKRFSESF